MNKRRLSGQHFPLLIALAVSYVSAANPPPQSETLREAALHSLEKAVTFFRTLSIRGGYVHIYDLESGQRWGEEPTDEYTVEVQPPGTPTVGMSYLRAFKVTGEREYLEAAEEAAGALIAGQNELGGWEHTIRFNGPTGQHVSFDDDQTQSAIRFLMALDQELESSSLQTAVEKALEMMRRSQFNNGAWPHRYPRQGNYHDFATFNDGGINDCILVMMNAHRYYGKPQYLESLQLAGSFLLLSQLPPPQPGWAQQYNQYLQPAWARSFEPPSVCTLVTIHNIETLLDLALYTKDERYLEPIPDALAWIADTRLKSGLWPRFVELGTNQPLYYDRGRVRVSSVDQLQVERRTGYRYEMDLSGELKRLSGELDKVRKALREGFSGRVETQISTVSESLIREIISQQDEEGRWVSQRTPPAQQRDGEVNEGKIVTRGQVRSSVFVRNVNALCDYLQQPR